MSWALTSSRSGAAVLLLMTLSGALLIGCFAPSAPGTPTELESPGSTASPSPASQAPSADTPPPLNRLELKVIDALARVGITGRRAQLPYDNADISAELTTGHLFVSAWPSTTAGGDFRVVDERRIEGRRIQVVEYSGSPMRHRFECSGDIYEVWGAVPASQDMDAFVARIIRALGCGS
jgi:hypothetical protein